MSKETAALLMRENVPLPRGESLVERRRSYKIWLMGLGGIVSDMCLLIGTVEDDATLVYRMMVDVGAGQYSPAVYQRALELLATLKRKVPADAASTPAAQTGLDTLVDDPGPAAVPEAGEPHHESVLPVDFGDGRRMVVSSIGGGLRGALPDWVRLKVIGNGIRAARVYVKPSLASSERARIRYKFHKTDAGSYWCDMYHILPRWPLASGRGNSKGEAFEAARLRSMEELDPVALGENSPSLAELRIALFKMEWEPEAEKAGNHGSE